VKKNTYKKSVDKRLEINLFDSVLFFVGVISICSILFLSLGIFNPLFALIGGLFLGVLMFLFKIKGVLNFRFDFKLFVILVIALILRFPVYNYIIGGQDQGVYLNMSKQLEKTGSFFLKDNMVEFLSEKQLEVYHENESALLPGISSTESKDIYTIPFYPVHPVWMSVFGLLGDEFRPYSLTFFSILSILLLAKISEITFRNRRWFYIVALLLAVNPLHAYFSKFPVSEIVALTFSLGGFYYLVRYFKITHSKIDLLMSLLMFLSFFFTRISAFLYLPFFYLIVLLNNLYNKDINSKKTLNLYLIFWFLFWFLSNIFYWKYLPELFFKIYDAYIVGSLGDYIVAKLGLLILILILIPILINRSFMISSFIKAVFGLIYKYRIYLLTIFFLLIAFATVFNLYKIGFSGKSYAPFTIDGIESVKYLGLTTFLLYLSPFLFILFVLSVYRVVKKGDSVKVLIAIFILSFLFYLTIFYKWTYYHYYYARYYLSELIPLACLFALYTFEIKDRFYVFKKVMVVLGIVYFVFFSALLIGKREGNDMKLYNEINSIVDTKDLIVIDISKLQAFRQIVTPLRYYYGYDTFNISFVSQIKYQKIFEIFKNYDQIYLLTSREDIGDTPNWDKIYSGEYKQYFISHCLKESVSFLSLEDSTEPFPYCQYMIIPNREYTGTQKIYLYRFNKAFDYKL